MISFRAVWPVFVLGIAVGPAHAQPQERAAAPASITGVVFVDENNDGVLGAGEPTLPGITVAWESSLVTTTDASGAYRLSVPADGIIWVRTPDGYLPSPTWKQIRVSAGAKTVDLGLRRAHANRPLSFIHASDSHIGVVPFDDLTAAFDQAGRLEPEPSFFVITGDITQSNSESEFHDLQAALADVDVPFVPVVGNHDVYDGGDAYRKALGPTQYSFDSGGVHFIVLEFGKLWSGIPAVEAEVLEFVRADVSRSPPGTPVVVFTHAPVSDAIAARLAEVGVRWMFTGHWHYNRIIEHGNLTEVNTQPLAMGGMDYTPAGYRVASFVDGAFVLDHFTLVDKPVLEFMYPRAGQCVPPGPTTVIVATETGAGRPQIALALDGGTAVEAHYAGGWTFTASVDFGASGNHSLVAQRRGGAAAPAEVSATICVSAPKSPANVADWPELMGAATHLGHTATAIAPPLETVWATTIGGHARGGSPVVAAGRLFVPVVDVGAGTQGGVVALDARTGAKLWEKRTGYAVHNAPAVHDDLVIFGASNGQVYAVNATTGADVWSYALGTNLDQQVSWLYAAPSLANGVVYIGVQRHFVALDAKTGRPLWQVDPSPSGTWLGSFSSAGVADGVVVAAFARGVDGMVAWDAIDGRELWRLPRPAATAVNTSIVIDGQMAWFGNAETVVYGVDLISAEVRWSRKLDENGFDFGYGLAATPALAGGKLIVPSEYNAVVALDAQSGAVEWTHRGTASVIRPVHYRGTGQKAFLASPVVTGDVVWIGGADGTLAALDLSSGDSLWSAQLGAPLLSGPVPAGELLFVATWDGTIQALRHSTGEPCPTCMGQASGNDDGCSVSRSRNAGRWLMAPTLGLLAAAWFRRRRPRHR